jgi:hypothetical protein
VAPELLTMLWRKEKFVASAWNFVLVQSIAKTVYEVILSSTSGVCKNGSMWSN